MGLSAVDDLLFDFDSRLGVVVLDLLSFFVSSFFFPSFFFSSFFFSFFLGSGALTQFSFRRASSSGISVCQRRQCLRQFGLVEITSQDGHLQGSTERAADIRGTAGAAALCSSGQHQRHDSTILVPILCARRPRSGHSLHLIWERNVDWLRER